MMRGLFFERDEDSWDFHPLAGRTNEPGAFIIERLSIPSAVAYRHRVKILIQDSRTRKFVSGKGEWTSEPANGEDFITASHAIFVARTEQIGDFKIVLYSTRFNYSLPVIRSQELETAPATGVRLNQNQSVPRQEAPVVLEPAVSVLA